MPKLIVVVAFDKDDDGELQTVFGPAEQQSENRAVRTARALAEKHAGVVAWSREANVDLGEYGPPTVLFQHGEVPDMEYPFVCRRSAAPGRLVARICAVKNH